MTALPFPAIAPDLVFAPLATAVGVLCALSDGETIQGEPGRAVMEQGQRRLDIASLFGR